MVKPNLRANLQKFAGFIIVMIIMGIIFYGLRYLYTIYISEPIMNRILKEPVTIIATITEKHSYKVRSFGLKYSFRGRELELSTTVSNETYKAYQEGDTISITISKSYPSSAILTSEYKEELRKSTQPH